MPKEFIELRIGESESGTRLDIFLAGHFPDYSRSYFQNLVKTGNVLVNNKETKPKYEVKNNDHIKLSFAEKAPLELKGEDIPLNIIYENNDLIVINKQPGLVVHPAAGDSAAIHFRPA